MNYCLVIFMIFSNSLNSVLEFEQMKRAQVGGNKKTFDLIRQQSMKNVTSNGNQVMLLNGAPNPPAACFNFKHALLFTAGL